ncbi:MAG: OmpA family protein [Methylococcaceae bacterium]
MNQLDTLDFDGLDGIHKLKLPSSTQNEDKKFAAFLASRNVVTATDEVETQTKKPFPLFLLTTLLIICLIGYFNFIALNNKSDLTPRLKKSNGSSNSLAKADEGENKLRATEYPVITAIKGKNEDIPVTTGIQKPVIKVDKNNSVNSELVPKLSTINSSTQQQETLNTEDSLQSADAKLELKTDINSKFKSNNTKQPITVAVLSKNKNDIAVISGAKKLTKEAEKLDKKIPSTLNSLPQIVPKAKTFDNDSTSTENQTIKFVLRFNFDTGPLADLSTTKLIVLNDFVQHCPDMIKIVGHTCNLGPLSYNQAVGLKRATWIKNFLALRSGLSVDRIKVDSAGPDNPIASNKTYAGRALNRRVVVSCLSPSKKFNR